MAHLTTGRAEAASSLGPVKQQNIKGNQVSLNRAKAQENCLHVKIQTHFIADYLLITHVS